MNSASPPPSVPDAYASASLSAFQPVLFPQAYFWFVLLAALDMIFTWVILRNPGGQELNVLADWVIRNFGVFGTAAYKFGLVVFVVVICEIVGRRRRRAGQVLSRSAVIITAFPVLVGGFHITNSLLHGDLVMS